MVKTQTRRREYRGGPVNATPKARPRTGQQVLKDLERPAPIPVPAKKQGKRIRRTTEKLIADLEARIEALKARTSVRGSAIEKRTLKLCGELRKAQVGAHTAGNTELGNVISASYNGLALYFTNKGFQLPRTRKRRATADEAVAST